MLVSVDDLLLFTYIYLFCFLGAFSKDMLDTFLEKIPKVLIFRVVISSLAVAILLYGFSEYLLGKLSIRLITYVCYISGIVSFEWMVRYSNIKDIIFLIKEVYDVKYDKNKDRG